MALRRQAHGHQIRWWRHGQVSHHDSARDSRIDDTRRRGLGAVDMDHHALPGPMHRDHNTGLGIQIHHLCVHLDKDQQEQRQAFRGSGQLHQIKRGVVPVGPTGTGNTKTGPRRASGHTGATQGTLKETRPGARRHSATVRRQAQIGDVRQDTHTRMAGLGQSDHPIPVDLTRRL